jgi:Electron transfer DM13
MKRNLLIGLGVAGVVALVAGVAAYQTWFAPVASQTVDQEFPDLGPPGTSSSITTGPMGSAAGGDEPPAPLRSGSFTGADSFHHASGTVSLYQASDGTFVLRFEDYDARSGPDVYFYLTRNAGDSSTAAVEEQGLRILVPGGAQGGQATLRGNFNVELPAGTNALAYRGITIWCDDFNEFFGSAPLS